MHKNRLRVHVQHLTRMWFHAQTAGCPQISNLIAMSTCSELVVYQNQSNLSTGEWLNTVPYVSRSTQAARRCASQCMIWCK
jgi:hypothetical protein